MDTICILKFAKGHNSVKIVGGDMVLVLSTLSDNACICSKFCQSICYRPEQ